jgi:hypothetical protein
VMKSRDDDAAVARPATWRGRLRLAVGRYPAGLSFARKGLVVVAIPVLLSLLTSLLFPPMQRRYDTAPTILTRTHEIGTERGGFRTLVNEAPLHGASAHDGHG